MATIVDSLIVTLGLDGKDFEKGHKKTQDALDKTRKDAEKTAKELEQRGKQAAQFFTKVRNEALAFFAVLAVGSGLKSFVENTIASASGLDRLSSNLGMSTKDLSEWQLAAKHAGGSIEGMTAQLKQSADDVAKFKMGLGSDSLNWFFRMGGSTDDLKDGNTYLMARADIIKKIYDVDPNKARVVAASMGISEDQFNLLKQGSAEVEKQRKAQAGLAEEMARASRPAEELRKKFDSLKNTFESISVNVLNSLMPVFDRMLVYFRELGDWVAGHKEQISQWVDKAVTSIIEFAKRLNEGAQALGGWQNVLIALLALNVLSFTANLVGMAVALGRVGAGLGLIGSVGAGALKILGPLALLLHSEGAGTGEDEALALRNGVKGPGSAGGSLSSRQQYLLSRLKMDGFSDAQAAGITGSLMQESGLDPSNVNPKSGARGIAQWLSKDRVSGFSKRYGHDLSKSSFEEQVDYMLWEMRNTEKRSGDLLRRAGSPQLAAQIHAWEYERPGVAEANIGQRQSYAESLFASIGKGNAMAAANLPTSASMPTMRYGGSPNSTVSSETHIGQITIQTAATDANGIAKDAQSAFQRYAFASQSNTGLN